MIVIRIYYFLKLQLPITSVRGGFSCGTKAFVCRLDLLNGNITCCADTPCRRRNSTALRPLPRRPSPATAPQNCRSNHFYPMDRSQLRRNGEATAAQLLCNSRATCVMRRTRVAQISHSGLIAVA